MDDNKKQNLFLNSAQAKDHSQGHLNLPESL